MNLYEAALRMQRSVSGFDALHHMARDPSAVYEWGGVEYRVKSGVLLSRPTYPRTKVAPWEESKVSPLEFIKNGWLRVEGGER